MKHELIGERAKDLPLWKTWLMLIRRRERERENSWEREFFERERERWGEESRIKGSHRTERKEMELFWRIMKTILCFGEREERDDTCCGGKTTRKTKKGEIFLTNLPWIVVYGVKSCVTVLDLDGQELNKTFSDCSMLKRMTEIAWLRD